MKGQQLLFSYSKTTAVSKWSLDSIDDCVEHILESDLVADVGEQTFAKIHASAESPPFKQVAEY